MNVLDPCITREAWSGEEVAALFCAQEELGNKWAAIAARLPGRPETAVKNTFYAAVRREERRVAAFLSGQEVPESFHAAVPSVPAVARLLVSLGHCSMDVALKVMACAPPSTPSPSSSVTTPGYTFPSPTAQQQQAQAARACVPLPHPAHAHTRHSSGAWDGGNTRKRSSVCEPDASGSDSDNDSDAYGAEGESPLPSPASAACGVFGRPRSFGCVVGEHELEARVLPPPPRRIHTPTPALSALSQCTLANAHVLVDPTFSHAHAHSHAHSHAHPLAYSYPFPFVGGDAVAPGMELGCLKQEQVQEQVKVERVSMSDAESQALCEEEWGSDGYGSGGDCSPLDSLTFAFPSLDPFFDLGEDAPHHQVLHHNSLHFDAHASSSFAAPAAPAAAPAAAASGTCAGVTSVPASAAPAVSDLDFVHARSFTMQCLAGESHEQLDDFSSWFH